jgi:SAM-dependent methyltransferase
MGDVRAPRLAPWENAVLAFARALPLPVPRALADPVGYDADVEARARRLYETFYSKWWATFAGARIVEIGGTGPAASLYLGYGPARYYLANVSLAEHFRERFAAEFADGRLTFVPSSKTAIPLPDASVDVIVSENTFEHLEDYPAQVAEFARILAPGGVLAAQFAPLYYSPLGAHLYEAIKLPWLTLLFPWPRVRAMLAVELARLGLSQHYEPLCEQFESLNRLRPDDFRAPFLGAAWDLRLFEASPFRWSLRAPEPLRSLLTHKLRIVARRRE